MRFFIIASLILSSISAVTAGKRKQDDHYSSDSDFAKIGPAKKRQKIDIKNILENFQNTSFDTFAQSNDINQILEEFENNSWHDDEQKDVITFLTKLITTNNLQSNLKEKAAYILWNIDKIAALTSCCLILHENNDWLIPFLNETIYKENAIDALFETYKDNDYIKIIKTVFVKSQNNNVIPFLNEAIYKNKSSSGKEFFCLLNTITILFQNMDQNLIESTLERFNSIFLDPNLHHESACQTLISLILQGPNTQTPFDCLETLAQISITNNLIKSALYLGNKKWKAEHYNQVLLALDKVSPNKRASIIQATYHLSNPNSLFVDPQSWTADLCQVITAFNETDKSDLHYSVDNCSLPLLFAKWFRFNTTLLLSALEQMRDLDPESQKSILDHINTLSKEQYFSENDYFWSIKALCQTSIEKHKDIINCILSMPKKYGTNWYNLIRSIEIIGTNSELIQNIDRNIENINLKYKEEFFSKINYYAKNLNWNPELCAKIIKIIFTANPTTHKKIFDFIKQLSPLPNMPNRLSLHIAYHIELLSLDIDSENINKLLTIFEKSSDHFIKWIINNIKNSFLKKSDCINNIISKINISNDENECIVLCENYNLNFNLYQLTRKCAPELSPQQAATITKIFMKTDTNEKNIRTTLNKLKKIHKETDISFLNDLGFDCKTDLQRVNKIVNSLTKHKSGQTQKNIITQFQRFMKIMNISKKEISTLFIDFTQLNEEEIILSKEIFSDNNCGFLNATKLRHNIKNLEFTDFNFILSLIKNFAKLEKNTREAILDDISLTRALWNEFKIKISPQNTLLQIEEFIKNAAHYKNINLKTKEETYNFIKNKIYDIKREYKINYFEHYNDQALSNIIKIFIHFKNKDNIYFDLYFKLHKQISHRFPSSYNFNFTFDSIIPVKHYDFFSQSMEKLINKKLGLTMEENRNPDDNKTPINYLFDFLTWLIENHPKDKEYYFEVGLKTLNALHIWHNFRNNYNWTVKYRLEITKKFIQDFAKSQGDNPPLNIQELSWKNAFTKALEPNVIIEELLLLDHSKKNNHPRINELMHQYLRLNRFIKNL